MKIPSIKKPLAWVVILVLIEICLVGYLGWWREFFWGAVQTKDSAQFVLLLSYFAGVALTLCYISGKSQYMITYSALTMRRKLTRLALIKYPRTKRTIEGIQQRIQEDCYQYPLLALNLAVGASKSLLTLCVFIYILVEQLGLVFLAIPVVYTILGTLLAGKLAFPLINLNYLNQVVEARFRQTLDKLDYAKSHRNNYNLAKTTKKLTYFQSFYNQIRVIVPHIMLFSTYFAGKISFGVYMQCSSAISEIIDNMSYLINVFGEINRLLSCRKRLKGIKII